MGFILIVLFGYLLIAGIGILGPLGCVLVSVGIGAIYGWVTEAAFEGAIGGGLIGLAIGVILIPFAEILHVPAHS